MTEPHDLKSITTHIAHDLSNLLTGVLGNLELMQIRAERSGVTDFDTYITGARSAANRAATFSNRLLAFAACNAQRPKAIELTALLRFMTDPLRDQGLPIHIAPASQEVEILCTPEQIIAAVQELLNNALDATTQGGEITLSATRSDNGARITIQDTGPGMSPETLARAPEPFFTTHPNATGRGLGLAIAQNLAIQAGGRLELASTLGEGTVASLWLPEKG
jgi:signal transduction histidine kinase